jgi:hypothetical protein
MIDSKTRACLDEAISKHLAAYGPREWAIVQQQFPNVPDATFWRMVRKVKARAVRSAGAKLLAPGATSEMDKGDAPPLARPLSDHDAAFCMNLRQHYKMLLDDVDLLRDTATDKNGEIVDSQMFAKSVGLRERVLASAIQTLQSLWDLGKMDDLYDEVVHAIQETSPEMQLTLMRRLQNLAESRGYS